MGAAAGAGRCRAPRKRLPPAAPPPAGAPHRAAAAPLSRVRPSQRPPLLQQPPRSCPQTGAPPCSRRPPPSGSRALSPTRRRPPWPRAHTRPPQGVTIPATRCFAPTETAAPPAGWGHQTGGRAPAARRSPLGQATLSGARPRDRRPLPRADASPGRWPRAGGCAPFGQAGWSPPGAPPPHPCSARVSPSRRQPPPVRKGISPHTGGRPSCRWPAALRKAPRTPAPQEGGSHTPTPLPGTSRRCFPSGRRPLSPSAGHLSPQHRAARSQAGGLPHAEGRPQSGRCQAAPQSGSPCSRTHLLPHAVRRPLSTEDRS